MALHRSSDPNKTRRVMGRCGAVGAAAVVVLAGCESVVEVRDPAAVPDDALNTPFVATTLANSVKGQLQIAFDDLAYLSAVLTDEAVTGHNSETWKEIDLRHLKDDNASLTEHYAL